MISFIPKSDFVCRYGAIYEDSRWVAERVWEQVSGNIDTDIEAIAGAMKSIVESATRDEKTDLIRAHPQLAVAVVDDHALSGYSAKEQAGAGLNQCTPEEATEFERLNREYFKKFGFPFVMAVRGMTKHQILNAFRKRIQNNSKQEFKSSMEQIHHIARFRLLDVTT